MPSSNPEKKSTRRAAFETFESRLMLTANPVSDLDAAPVPSEVEGIDQIEIAPNLAEANQATGVDYVHEDYGFDGSGQTIAVIDSGIAWDHYALGGGYGENHKVVGGWDFAENDANPYDDAPGGFHGSHVAGIIGSNDQTNTGVASGADLVALRVFDDYGVGDFDMVEAALQWVHDHRNDFENPITTVNLSLGTKWNADTVPEWSNLEDEFALLESDGIFISVAAGNSFESIGTDELSYPASSEFVVPVASHGSDGTISDFSQRDERVLVAPGEKITSTVPEHVVGGTGPAKSFFAASGTSMATPYVAGASALLRQAMDFMGEKDIDQDALYDHFRDTADYIYDSVTKTSYANINIGNAIDQIVGDSHGDTIKNAFNLGSVKDLQSLQGTVGKISDLDYFTFQATTTGTASFTINTTHDLAADVGLVGGGLTQNEDNYSFSVEAGKNYSFYVGTSEGIGHYSIELEMPAEFSIQAGDWGSAAQQTIGINVSGESWYQVGAQQNGTLTVELLDAANKDNVQFEIYDSQLRLIDSNASGNPDRIDIVAQKGESYFVRFDGNCSDVDVRVSNLIQQQNDASVINGNQEDETRVTVEDQINEKINAVAINDTAATDQGHTVSVDVVANDADTDATDQLRLSGVSLARGLGSASIVDNQIVYDPSGAYDDLAVGETATVVVDYTLDDGQGGSDTAQLTITVSGSNDGPVASHDTAATDQDNAVSVDVVANDADTDATDQLRLSGVSLARGLGSASIVDNQIVYDPSGAYDDLAVGETATVVVDYTLDDGQGGSDTAQLTITVSGSNDGPVASHDTAATDQDNAVSVDVVANDADTDTTDQLRLSGVSLARGLGSASIVDNQIVYDPSGAYDDLAVGETATVVVDYTLDDGQGGSDTAQLTITVSGSNDGPQASHDTAATDQGHTVSVDVVANDADTDATDQLRLSGVSLARGLGSASIVDNQIVYDPSGAYDDLAVGETATVVVDYTLDDGQGGSDTAQLTITVSGSNDGPQASHDTAATDQDNAVSVDVVANDADTDATDQLRLSGVSLARGLGSASIVDNQIVYDPSGAYDDLAVGETATVVVDYTLDDGQGGSDTAQLTITVSGSNDGPQASHDTAATDQGHTVSVDVVANDADTDTTDQLRLSGVSLARGLGSASIVDNQIVYDPSGAYDDLAVGETATVVVDYTLDDGQGGSDTAQLTITVSGSNDGPQASHDTAATDQGHTVSVDVVANDADTDTTDQLRLSGVSLARGLGSASIVDNQIVYDPSGAYDDLAVGETATVVVDYTLDDGQGGSDTAQLTITVSGSNDGPQASHDTAATDQGHTVSVDVVANDADTDATDQLRLSGVSLARGLGSASIVDNQIVYDPSGAYDDLAVGETATVVVDYTLDDGQGGSDTAQLTITVSGSNDGPLADNDANASGQGNSVAVDVIAQDNDTDTSDIPTITAAPDLTERGSEAQDTFVGSIIADQIDASTVFEDVEVSSRGRADHDVIIDSDENDYFVTVGISNTIEDNDDPTVVKGIDRNLTISSNGQMDLAIKYGNIGNDRVISKNANTIIRGGESYCHTQRFGSVTFNTFDGSDDGQFFQTRSSNLFEVHRNGLTVSRDSSSTIDKGLSSVNDNGGEDVDSVLISEIGQLDELDGIRSFARFGYEDLAVALREIEAVMAQVQAGQDVPGGQTPQAANAELTAMEFVFSQEGIW